MGGGKSLVKLTTYTIILFSILSNTVNSARKKSSNIKRAASTKRAATSNKPSAKKSTKRAATSRRKVTPKTSATNTTATATASANQIKEAEAEAQRLKAEAEAERQKLVQERQNLEAERQKLEEERKRLESERKADEERKAEEERVKAEAEAAAAAVAAAAEAEKAKKEAEEREKAEAEEQRLLALRIKKVEGTADDYTCIDGWTNYWNMERSYEGFKILDRLMPSKLMDSNGKIKEPLDGLDNTHYSKTLNGCFVKTSEILTINGIIPHEDKDLLNGEVIFFYDSSEKDIYTQTMVVVYKYEMGANDVTNDPRTGWTDEEKTKWNGYKPIIGMYYRTNYGTEGKIASGYYKKSLNKEEAIKIYKKFKETVDKYWPDFRIWVS